MRYVGEPVAAVFAEHPYIAEDAAALVGVEIEEPPRSSPPPTSRASSRAVFRPNPSRCAVHHGDLDGAFATAAHTFELELSIGRHSGTPLETRGALARYDTARDVLELYGAAKVPHRTRDNLARILGRAPTSVHLKEGHTGGGFGIRGELYPKTFSFPLPRSNSTGP